MDCLTYKIRNTLSARLGKWVVLFCTLLFMAVLWIMLWFARQAVKEEAIEKARSTLDSAVLSIDNELADVETAVRNSVWHVESHLDDPDMMMSLSRSIVEVNPAIEGCAIAFEPDFYPSKGRYYMAYYHRVGNHIVRSDHFGDVPYAEQEWVTLPLLSGRPGWINPLTVSKYSPHPITTYSMPLFSEPGTPAVGVLAVDVALEGLSATIQSARPFSRTYCAMMDQNGTFIIHPDSTQVGNITVWDQLERFPSHEGERLAKAMLSGESGSMVMDFWGYANYVFYRPFKSIGWSVDIVCPESEIFASYRYLLRVAIALSLAGLLVLLLFILFYIGWQMRPLYKLDASVQQLAQGKFDQPLPSTSRADEIGHMQRAFSEMQQSLASYLEKISVQQQELDQRGEALRAAYDRTKEAENAKAVFMHSASDQLTHPVVVIGDIVDRIHQDHARFDPDEIGHMTQQLSDQTSCVLELLDRMIAVSTTTPK